MNNSSSYLYFRFWSCRSISDHSSQILNKVQIWALRWPRKYILRFLGSGDNSWQHLTCVLGRYRAGKWSHSHGGVWLKIASDGLKFGGSFPFSWFLWFDEELQLHTTRTNPPPRLFSGGLQFSTSNAVKTFRLENAKHIDAFGSGYNKETRRTKGSSSIARGVATGGGERCWGSVTPRLVGPKDLVPLPRASLLAGAVLEDQARPSQPSVASILAKIL